MLNHFHYNFYLSFPPLFYYVAGRVFPSKARHFERGNYYPPQRCVRFLFLFFSFSPSFLLQLCFLFKKHIPGEYEGGNKSVNDTSKGCIRRDKDSNKKGAVALYPFPFVIQSLSQEQIHILHHFLLPLWSSLGE